jgi:hypothetical protein
MPKVFLTSLTRISDLETRPYEASTLPLEQWGEGDYVLAEVCARPTGFSHVELATGRIVEVVEGDRIIGAFGVRHATLEAVGSWRDVPLGGRMEVLTAGGILGKVTSLATSYPPLLPVQYKGHVVRDGRKVCMSDFVPDGPDGPYTCPTVLIVGTTMSGGKTTTAKVIVRELKAAGLRVTGAKLSGAGRYRDILGMGDAGADAIFDFVDVGLPSTVVPRDEFEVRLRRLLTLIARSRPDVVVVEAGASPLEPYNGDTVLDAIRDQVRCTVLCASDPYAVVGVMRAFGIEPDLIAGLATSTSAGVELCERLVDRPALNVLARESREKLNGIVLGCLDPVA